MGCAVLLLLPLLYYGLQVAERTPALGEVVIAAHRGGARYGPENTLAAFRNAAAQEADAIEFDVQMSRDGALVVIHDDTVDRTTNGTGAVGALTLAEIRALDAGDGEQVPTFEEVLALAKSVGLTVLPEAKSPGLHPGLEERMLQAIRAADYADHTIVQSFDADSLRRLQQLDPGMQLCALYGTGQFNLGSPAGDADYVCPMGEMILLDPAMIRQAHSEGRRVYVWFLGLEDPLTVSVLRFFGADGFIVNDPLSARRALGR